MANKTYDTRTLETIVELLVIQRDNDQNNFDRVTKAIKELTLNVGQLATEQKVTAQNIANLTQAIREQNQVINGHLSVAQARLRTLQN